MIEGLPAKPEPCLRLDDQLCFALYTATSAAVRAYRPQLQEIGLTYPQYVLLMALWEKDDVSVSELGDRLNLPVSGVAPVLDRLERAGLLDRRRGTRDRRILMVVLTDAGRALEELAARFHHRVHCQTELSGSQLVGLRTQLHALTRAMEDVLDTNTTIS